MIDGKALVDSRDATALTDVACPPSRCTPDLVCHFHFLAVVGGRLLDADHATVRRALASCKMRGGLVRSARRSGCTASDCERERDLPALLYWASEGDGGRQPRSRTERRILQRAPTWSSPSGRAPSA